MTLIFGGPDATVSKSTSGGQSNNFSFRKKRESINWRLLASVNVEAITRELDVKILQEVLETVTYCDIQSEGLHLDPSFVKLFQLAQLIIEYLIYSQESLVSKASANENAKKELDARLISNNEQISKLSTQVAELNRENRQLKKTIYAYQLWSQTPGVIGNAQQQPPVASYHRCRYCSKVFNSDYYLDSHLERRHPDKLNYVHQKEESLKMAAVPITAPPMDTALLDRITNTIERFSTRVLETERKLREEMEIKFLAEIERKERNMQEAYKQERDHYERELQDLRSTMTRQLEDSKNALREERLAFENYKNSVSKPSNIGKLEDDLDEEQRKKQLQAEVDKKLAQYEILQSRTFDKLQEENSKLRASVEELEKKAKEPAVKEAKIQPVLPPPATEPRRSEPRVRKDTSLWPEYLAIADSFSHTPFPKNTLIKAKYSHEETLLEGKRKEICVLLEAQSIKRHITPANMSNEELIIKIAHGIRKERADTDKVNPYLPFARQYITDAIEDIVGKKFRLRPLKPAILLNPDYTISMPDKATFFANGLNASEPASATKARRDSYSQSVYSHKSLRSLNSLHSEVNWDIDNKSEDSDSGPEDDAQTTLSVSKSNPVIPNEDKTNAPKEKNKSSVVDVASPKTPLPPSIPTTADSSNNNSRATSPTKTAASGGVLKAFSGIFKRKNQAVNNNSKAELAPADKDANEKESEYEISELSASIDSV